jgi:3-hydroxyisobutyrate dehydrogenase
VTVGAEAAIRAGDVATARTSVTRQSIIAQDRRITKTFDRPLVVRRGLRRDARSSTTGTLETCHSPAMAKIAVLGTGLIGAALAEAAVRRGDEVKAWNRTAAKARVLETVGVRAMDAASEAVNGAERVHVALSDDAAVDAVIAECERAIGEAVIVDHTTASPHGTRARSERLEAKGIAYLHVPVFMSPSMCRAGGGIMLASGPPAVYERVAGALAAMTGKVHYLGERRDLAAAYKLFGNAMIISITAGLADVYTMAKALDIDATDAHGLFSIFDPSGNLKMRGKSMAEGRFAASFELTMARKDVRLMIDAAGSGPLAVLPGIAARIDALLERGHGGDDLGALAIDAVERSD